MPTVAIARYVGNARTHRRSCPSGTTYRFQNRPSAETDDSVAIDNTADAEYLDERVPDSIVEVEWTSSGKAQDTVEEAAASVSDAVDRMLDWGYDRKQDMARELRDRGVLPEDFALNQREEDLEAELSDHAEMLAEAMED